MDENICTSREKSLISDGEEMRAAISVYIFGSGVNASQAVHPGQRLAGRPAHWARGSLTCVRDPE